jgi:SAM-dependent methyltransferase
VIFDLRYDTGIIRMKTMDTLENLPSGAISSPSARRNIEPIRQVLAAHFPTHGRVLEIAAGSGEHAVAFAGAFPGLDWTAAEPSEEARASIAAWTGFHGLANLRAPVDMDAVDLATWPQGPFDAVLCINMIHISPWAATEGLMAGAGRVLADPGGLLALYGPYREADVALAPSNAAFDDSLRSRDPVWGLRDRDAVVAEAKRHGLHLTQRVAMPANNLMLLFRRA